MKISDAKVIKVVQGLFLLNAVIWVVFGVINMARMSTDGVSQPAVLRAFSIMMYGNAIAMTLSAWLVGKKEIWGYIFAMAIVVVNIFLTFTGQVGFFDIVTVMIDIVLLGLLLLKRKVFFSSPEKGLT